MFDALQCIASFVTVTVSLLYGTRIAWICGRKCSFKEKTENRKQMLFESVPSATAIFFFGFLVLYNYCLNGVVTIFIASLTSAILLAGMLVSMAMPELRRKPQTRDD